MDYNVFLLSRIHEAHNEGDGPRESVIHGVGRIGKVLVFAGLIMSRASWASSPATTSSARCSGSGSDSRS